MARILATSVPNFEPASGDYPSGRIKNKTVSEAGTSVVEELYGDQVQMSEKVIRDSGLTKNNLPDNESNGYQMLEAFDNRYKTGGVRTYLSGTVIDMSKSQIFLKTITITTSFTFNNSKLGTVVFLELNNAENVKYRFPLNTLVYGDLSSGGRKDIIIQCTNATPGSEEYIVRVWDGGVISGTFDLEFMSDENQSFQVGFQENFPTGMTFNNDGTKLYIVGSGSNTVYQYTLSTPFNVTTASYDSVSFSVVARTTSANSVTFNDDGTFMYIASSGDNRLLQFALSTPFDISTSSFLYGFTTGAETIFPSGIALNSDGTKVYVSGSASSSVSQYTLTNPYIINSAVYDNVVIAVSQDSTPSDIVFNNDGTKLYIVGDNTNKIYQYSLSEPFDLSTFSYDGVNIDVSTNDTSPTAMTFSNDGIRMHFLGLGTTRVYQYSI